MVVPAGAPPLGSSATVLEVLLAADKASLIDALATDRAAMISDRDLAKRVGLILHTTPYGAPASVILERMRSDPDVQERLPNPSMEALEILHQRFPGIVPKPNVPVDMGSIDRLTQEGSLDLWASRLLTADDRRAQFVAEAYGDPHLTTPEASFRERYAPGSVGLSDAAFPSQGALRPAIDPIRRALGYDFFLRRTILEAPPQWGPKEIARDYNRYLDFIAPLHWTGNEPLSEARARAEMTPERVADLMNRYPQETGALALSARQRKLRDVIKDELSRAQPSENLYAVLAKSCARLEPETAAASADDHVFERPPAIEAALRAEDLVPFIAGDPGLSRHIDRLLEGRQKSLDRILANQIHRTLGPKISEFSMSEIVTVMKAKDPIYNEILIRHLFDSFPAMFGGVRTETGRVQINWLLGHLVANAMDRMFPGATLQMVADFLRESDRGFQATYPNFSESDIRLLQAAYPFIPQWEAKPAEASGAGSSPLQTFLAFAHEQLGHEQGRELTNAIQASIAKDLDADVISPELRSKIDRTYAQSLLHLVAETFGVSTVRQVEGHSSLDIYLRYLEATPDSAVMDEVALAKTLSAKNLFRLPADRASSIAKALVQARALDFAGLKTTLRTLLVGQPNAELVSEKVSNKALGYHGLLMGLEHDVLKNRELKAELKRYARIPLRLPMIQSIVDKYQAEQPLKDANVLMVQHILGQAYPQIAGYTALGMKAEDTIFVGIPYHPNNEVAQAIGHSFGVDVRIPERDMAALKAAIRKGVDDIVKKHRENKKQCLIVCDGPYAREYFEEAYPDLAHSENVRFTEQTAFGDRPEYRSDTSKSVTSYARIDLKAKKEAKFIGQAVCRAVTAVESELGTGHEQKPVLVLGLGPVGIATAEAFSGDRAKVYVYDPNPSEEALRLAAENGWVILRDKSQIAKGKFLMVGCSGHLSIDEEVILASEPNAIYVSASSKLVEIDMAKLAELARDDEGRIRKVLAAEVNDQQTWHYWLKDGTIRTVIADGLPANFNDINSVPPEWIDMTMASGLAAAVQAMRSYRRGFFDLNAEDQTLLDGQYNAMLERIHREARIAADADAALNRSV